MKFLKFDTAVMGLIQDSNESGGGAAGPLVHGSQLNLLNLSGPEVEVPHGPCLEKGPAEVLLPGTTKKS